MPNINRIVRAMPIDNTESKFRVITDLVRETCDNQQLRSTEKYNLKAKLIDEADDMTINEKLEALDQNYNNHCQEVWVSIMILGTISFFIHLFTHQ